MGGASGRMLRSVYVPERPSILCVDDEADLLDMLVEALRLDGYDVTGVESAEAGLDALRTRHFDVVLTDFNLPGENGLWLLEQARAAGLLAHTGALVVSAAHQLPKDASQFRVLRKPVDFALLEHEIEQQLASLTPRALVAEAPPMSIAIELVLYISRDSTASTRAQRNLLRVLDQYDGASVRIVDVASDPDGAAADRVDFTPTLVRRAPLPRRWLIGDLRSIQPLEQLLEHSGARRRTS